MPAGRKHPYPEVLGAILGRRLPSGDSAASPPGIDPLVRRLLGIRLHDGIDCRKARFAVRLPWAASGRPRSGGCLLLARRCVPGCPPNQITATSRFCTAGHACEDHSSVQCPEHAAVVLGCWRGADYLELVEKLCATTGVFVAVGRSRREELQCFGAVGEDQRQPWDNTNRVVSNRVVSKGPVSPPKARMKGRLINPKPPLSCFMMARALYSGLLWPVLPPIRKSVFFDTTPLDTTPFLFLRQPTT